jgi:hypothetical protein
MLRLELRWFKHTALTCMFGCTETNVHLLQPMGVHPLTITETGDSVQPVGVLRADASTKTVHKVCMAASGSSRSHVHFVHSFCVGICSQQTAVQSAVNPSWVHLRRQAQPSSAAAAAAAVGLQHTMCRSPGGNEVCVVRPAFRFLLATRNQQRCNQPAPRNRHPSEYHVCSATVKRMPSSGPLPLAAQRDHTQ